MEEQLALDAGGRLLELGVAGIFIMVQMVAIIYLWRALQSRDKYIREQSVNFVSLVNETTNVIDKVYTKTDNLPNDLKDKIQPSLDVLSEKLQNIRDNIKT